MKKHFIANKYLPIALVLAAFTAAGTAPVFAQQSGPDAGISTRNARPFVHKQSIHHSGYSAYGRIFDYNTVAPSSVGRPDPDPFPFIGWSVH
jgi:hypothetical protein